MQDEKLGITLRQIIRLRRGQARLGTSVTICSQERRQLRQRIELLAKITGYPASPAQGAVSIEFTATRIGGCGRGAGAGCVTSTRKTQEI